MTDAAADADQAISGRDRDGNPLKDFQFDPFRSFPESLQRIEEWLPISDRTRANIDKALASIDRDERSAFLERHASALKSFDRLGPHKYADLPYWTHQHALIAQWLDLDRSETIDILDIGMGSGSFAMVAQSMGHRIVGTDVASDWYGELCRLAHVERIVAPVHRGERYAPLDRRFDLITIMLPAFHRQRIDGKRVYWSIENWRVFLLGLVRDLLKKNGRIFILLPLDKDDEGRLSYSPLIEWARSRHARLDRTFANGVIRHILFDRATEATFGAGGAR